MPSTYAAAAAAAAAAFYFYHVSLYTYEQVYSRYKISLRRLVRSDKKAIKKKTLIRAGKNTSKPNYAQKKVLKYTVQV